MYVANDVTHDSRVRREAASLARAGHCVTIVATAAPDQVGRPSEDVDGFRIIRVPWRRDTAWWVTWVHRPWVLVGSGLRSVRQGLRAGPAAWPSALGTLLGLAASGPWIVVRGAWYTIFSKRRGRASSLGGLLYVRKWQAEILPWCRTAVSAAPRADVHHAHDMEALPAAREAARRDGTPYVYDSHEIFIAWGAVLRLPVLVRWAFALWERRMARDAAALVTVNRSIAEVLEQTLHPRRVVVVRNCPPRWQPRPGSPDRLREPLGLPAGTPIALYHGGFGRHRGLEQLAAALREPGLEAVHAVYLGYGALEPELRAAAADPATGGRLHVLPAVPPEDLLATIAPADVAVMAIQPDTLNHRLSTPNKLFEAIAAGVPVVASDFVAIREVVDDPAGPLGVLVDPTDPAAIAAGIRAILEAPPEDRRALRARCLAAAHRRWNWETESVALVELYADLATGTTPPSPGPVAG